MPIDPYKIAEKMTCPYCSSGVDYRPNEIIYGKPFGWGYAYICKRYPECDAYVGCHGSKADPRIQGAPLGELANGKLRELRRSVHAMIDPYWQTPGAGLSRKQVYQLLSEMLRIPLERTHIGMFTEEQCQKVLSGWNEFLPDRFKNMFLSPPRILPPK